MNKIFHKLTPFLAFILGTILVKLEIGLPWIWSTLIGLLIGILFYFAVKYNWIKKREKTKEELEIKELETLKLQQLIEEKKEWLEFAEKNYNRRKDKPLSKKIGDEVDSFLIYGSVIFFLGIIMFGGLSSYFGVNNEFINPTNQTNFSNSSVLGNSSNSIEMVGNVCEFTLTTVMDIGKGQPKLWFWIFWAGVFMFMILPILTIIYHLIKHRIFKKKKEVEIQ